MIAKILQAWYNGAIAKDEENMSHFTVGVIVPSNLNNDELTTYIDAKLAPYDENLEVEEWQQPCDCVDPSGCPVLNCEDCNGTGVQLSTYNLDRKWDWWEVGGRWNGVLYNNRVPLEGLASREEVYTFFAIVTPDGTWHEKGRMAWFAVVVDEMDKEDWRAISLNIYNQYKSGYDIVMVDAHI